MTARDANPAPDAPGYDETAPVVVMGVSGCGKSTVGAALAVRMGRPFLDGDRLHPPANIRKMQQGVPLTDADRWPWLAACNARLRAHPDQPGLVLACSALRRAYRDRLRAGLERVHFIHLLATEAQLRARMERRPGHFMPVTLLHNQLYTLEMPAEPRPGGSAYDVALTLDATLPVDQLVAEAVAFITSSRR